MKAKESSKKEILVGKLCKFNEIIVLIVKEEDRQNTSDSKSYYALFPGQGIDTLSKASLEVL
jgi:hypothetical protein